MMRHLEKCSLLHLVMQGQIAQAKDEHPEYGIIKTSLIRAIITK